MKKFSLPRKKIGIAWLKDKHALARQRFCFHTSDVSKIGDNVFLKSLQEVTKVIDFGFGVQPLNLSSQITNSFWIRLRKDPKNREKKALIQSFNDPKSKMKGGTVSTGIKGEDVGKEMLEQRLKKLYTEWFLNLYGEQRFGWTHANHRIAQEIIDGKKKNMDKSEVMFKLQSLSSRLFNNYCTYREKKHGNIWIEWDIIVNDQITGPLFWDDLQRADIDTEAGKLEQERKTHFEIDKTLTDIYKKYGLFWLRRPIRVKPTKASHSRQGEDLLLQFTLAKGSYASVLVEELLWE